MLPLALPTFKGASMELGNIIEQSNKYEDRNFLIICAGSTIRAYYDDIEKFARDNNTIVIGINNALHITPFDYHLFTNRNRFLDYKQNIKLSSELILGCNLIKKTPLFEDYWRVDYTEDELINYSNSGNVIYGQFRTAGCLAIYISYLLGAKKTYIAGMDGYTLEYAGNQHCYGAGFTDSEDTELEEIKDDTVGNILDRISRCINFSIITPTVFKKHRKRLF